MKIVKPLALALSALVLAASGPLDPRPNGMQPERPTRHMIVGATVHLAPGEMYEATDTKRPAVLIEDGAIVGVLENANTARLKPGYVVHEFSGDHHVYAGFIDGYVPVDAPTLEPGSAGTHWNTFVTPQRDALAGEGLTDDHKSELRAMGFTTAMIAPRGGVFRGWSAVVSTADDHGDASLGDAPVYRANAAQVHGFDRTGWRVGTYPTSHMGVMALLRQTFSDAESRAKSNHADASCLDHIDPDAVPLVYDTDHELEALLADKVAREFGHKDLVIVGSGREHRRLGALAEMGHPVIVPLRFPETPEVASVNDADGVSLTAMQHWERAPANARWLMNAGLDVALTSSKRRDGEKFWDNLHDAIEKGLPADDALAMLTTNPAKILDLDDQGEINRGMRANLIVASGDLFDPGSDAQILDVWADGRKHTVNEGTNDAFDGTWDVTIAGTNLTSTMTIDDEDVKITHEHDGETVTTACKNVELGDGVISFTTDVKDDGVGALITTGTLINPTTMRGSTLAPNFNNVAWVARRSGDAVSMKDFKGSWDATLSGRFELTFKVGAKKVTVIEHVEDGDDITQESATAGIEDGSLVFTFDHEPFGMPGTFTITLEQPRGDELSGSGERADGAAFTLTAVTSDKDSGTHTLPDAPETPFGPYTFDEHPEATSVLIHSATVWTQSDDGIIDNGWVLIRNGKIHSVGQGGYPRIRVDETIDGTGLHITPGLIDAHSHTGLFQLGVNEAGQAVTSECRIADSLDPSHIGFYRELAGGLTSALLLHGSANPIGGQSQTIKLRWGADKPEDMHFQDAKPGIKFALGENVKQSNWGDDKTTRYPQTRLGVETIFRDRFTKAREYAERGGKTPDGRRDIELETIAQILAGERWIHCHSYRQDEILMLCRVAEDFGFTIGTFQHGLETYKVAEVVREHAIGASLFSDWWAYKVEVQDAIPFAGPINHEAGLLTSFNSDSDDLARRMHAEAGKAFKYARMSGIEMTEQEALAFVTNNPAIQLGIFDKVGSLEKGKDADVAVWSGHPLSSLSRCEMTFVDGVKYFSIEEDAAHRQRIAAERERLVQMLLESDVSKKPETDTPGESRGLARFRFDETYNHSNQGDCGCDDLFPHFVGID